MSWRERDYTWFPGSEGGYRDRVGTWREFLPPRVSGALIVVHLVAFIAIAIAGGGLKSGPNLSLGGERIGWQGVLTHPVAATSAFSALFIISVIWTLGSRIERLLGARTMLGLYVLGNLFGGLAFVAAAGWRGDFGAVPLVSPLGGMMAWLVTIWRRLSFELIPIFTMIVPLAKAAAFVAAIGILGVVLTAGAAGLAWLAAAVIGAAVAPVVELIERSAFFRGRHPALRRRGRPEADSTADSGEWAASDDDDQTEESEIPIDDVLAKISREGMASLNSSERERLEQARQQRLRRSGSSSRTR